MSGTTAPPDDRGLAASLAALPHARVTAIDPDGLFCPMPAELGSTHEVLPGPSVFELVPPSHWPTVITGWERVHQYGTHHGILTTNDGLTWSALYDARERFGVFVLLLIPIEAWEAEEAPEDTRPVVSRFGVFHRDAHGRIIGVDGGARGLLGWDLADIPDVAPRQFIHPDDGANADANWLRALVSPGKPQRWRGRHLDSDDTFRWIEFTTTNLLDEEGYVVSEMMDISEEMSTVDALRERDELLAGLNDALPLGVARIDLDRRIVYANQRLATMVARTSQETFGEQFAALADADRTALDDALTRTLTAGTEADLEVRLSLGDGCRPTTDPDRVCAISIRALRQADRISGAVLCVSDITEATTMRRELERQATFDRLTGCLNPAATVSAIGQVLQDRDTTTDGTALLFIDLDKFKAINDTLGHAAGDEVLAAVADRLRHLTRADDLVGRVGGDEFVVVCPGTSEATATAVAERVTAALGKPMTAAGTTVQIGASVGVSWTPDDGTTAEELVSSADAAMYERKRARREPEAAGH